MKPAKYIDTTHVFAYHIVLLPLFLEALTYPRSRSVPGNLIYLRIYVAIFHFPFMHFRWVI